MKRILSPPFGSTDIIECSGEFFFVHAAAVRPPFGSTDIIECSVITRKQQIFLNEPPFGSTDIIECSTSFLPSSKVFIIRHSVALILSSAAFYEGKPTLC